MIQSTPAVSRTCALLLCLALIFFPLSCTAEATRMNSASMQSAMEDAILTTKAQSQSTAFTLPSEETTALLTRNLQKLCKVWGYVKYTHPAFLSGQKDWDAELLALIESISAVSSDEEANNILYHWFIGLGKIDYDTDFYDKSWINATDDQKIFLAETGWLADTAYLGRRLSVVLSQLGEVPTVYRGKAPVYFGDFRINSVNSMFTNEKTYEDSSFADNRYRLLGLFRLWNVIEYYYPYRNILDDDWNGMLLELIPKMLEGTDKQSYQLTIAELAAKLHDAHVGFTDSGFLFDEFGQYAAPVSLIWAEGQLVIRDIYEECELLPGDVLLELDGRNIWDIVAGCKQYVSVTTDEKLMNALSIFLLRSHESEMVFTILRQNEELTVTVLGVMSIFHSFPTATQSHVLLEDNIGLINPFSVVSGDIPQIMDTFSDTCGLIVDWRQPPSSDMMYTLAEYLVDGRMPFCLYQYPSRVMPGAYIRNVTFYSGNGGKAPYDKPVVILMDEHTQSSAEFTVMSLRNGANVIVMGNNSVGSDGDVTTLPLPCGNIFVFTGLGAFTPEGGQTQRIGLSPDIFVEPTIAGIREGRDELMEAAVQYILDHQ